MASSSSSTVMASSAVKASNYDVFLSFRGEDTRHAFTDHLYHKLKQAGIYTFRDDEEIRRGEELKPEIERAIKASRSSIVVLSENYATSTWCLDELLLILEERRECNHVVLPVFYHVNPADVRKQKGSFAIQVKPSSRWTSDKVNLWKRALMEIANLSGFTLVSGFETNFIKEIVDTIYNKLDRKEVHLPLNITGMATRYKDIDSWLDQLNLTFLAIYGMGGSGKTTLAKYIFYSNRRKFEYVSFIEDIGSRCKGPNDLLQLQEQLLKDISRRGKRKIDGVSQGMCVIEEVLQMNRMLIVLDDIVEYSQLVALLGNVKINPESKIIITTREDTYNWFKLSWWRCRRYEMRLLNADESLELLSRHAFGSKIPNLGYDRLVRRAIGLCEGHPLALEVLGSYLLKNDAIPYWESLLSLFGKDIDSRIQGVLIRSYMSLPFDSVKELFLHIACFFIGMDMDYVVKILEPDYSATFGVKTLIKRCLLSVSPNKKIMMHTLIQEMAKNIVRQESPKFPTKRSRVWLSSDSYKILREGKGSKMVEGLALDMKMLQKEDFAFTSSNLKTDALKMMEHLKLLQLNFVELNGSYENFSVDLRWLCWLGFHLRTIPFDLYMGNLVAMDMSYSNLEVFEPPTVLRSLQILNFKDSHNLVEIRNILNIPNLETLILWNCRRLVNVCEHLGELSSLSLLNMTGCRHLFCNIDKVVVSPSGLRVLKSPTFSFPRSLHRLFLKGCDLNFIDSFPLSFSLHQYLQYLNFCNCTFESLPCYDHLENLRVLDLNHCFRLKYLRLPNTLAELYVYDCTSLVKISFQSPRFTLQEFGYFHCYSLYEVEGLFKLIPICELDETDLGHMKWLKEYQEEWVSLVGDDGITRDRDSRIQMLYEFNIMSTSLPDIEDPNLRFEYKSKSSSLSLVVPSCPKNKRLKGINVTFKYGNTSDEWVWFCKVSTDNGVVDLMYNPRVFGKSWSDKVHIWLSYWPVGNALEVGDTVNVSIVVLNGLEVHECGVSLVYSNLETVESNLGWDEILRGDLSGFELSTGAYYLCRRDFFELMEVGRLTTDWFRILVGDTGDYTEVRGWRKTGRPKQVNDPSFTELKTVRCVIDGPLLDDIYKIPNYKSKSSIGDTTFEFKSLSEGETESRSKYDRYTHSPSIRLAPSPFVEPSDSSSSPFMPMMEQPYHQPHSSPPDHYNMPTEDEEHTGPLAKIKSACSVM